MSEPQEWTPDTVNNLARYDGYKGVADAHNAAIAAEREDAYDCGYLAAMRQPQEDTLKRIEELIDAYNDTDIRPAVAVLSDIEVIMSQARQEKP